MKSRVVISILAVAAILELLVAFGIQSNYQSISISKEQSLSRISLTDMKLCSANCSSLCTCDNPTPPYLLGWVAVNAHAPLSTLKVYVNGAYVELVYQNGPSNPCTCTVEGNYTLCPSCPIYESRTMFNTHVGAWVPANVVPVVRGGKYSITFTAGFEDGSNFTATVSVIAS